MKQTGRSDMPGFELHMHTIWRESMEVQQTSARRQRIWQHRAAFSLKGTVQHEMKESQTADMQV